MINSEIGGFLRNRFIQSIMLSSVFLQIGIWVRNFAILLFVMDKTNNDPFAVSLISVAEYAPILLFSLIGGIYADRWRPKLTMIWCDILSALSVFIILLAIIFASWEAVFFVTFISAILSQFSQPSIMKLFKVYLPKEQIQMGMAMYQTFMSLFMIIGPIIGTLIYQNFGINTSIAITGATFLLSAAGLSLIPVDDKVTVKSSKNNFWLELKSGLFYVLEKKVLVTLGGIFVVMGLAIGIVQTLGIFIITESLELPKENFQWLLTVNGVAMLIGGTFVTGLVKKINPRKSLAIGLLVNAINVVAIVVSTNWYLTLAIQFINGLFMPCVHIGINTLILQTTEERFIGRVNGVLNPMLMAAMVLTMSLAGWLKIQFSLLTMYGAAAAFFFLGFLLTMFLSRFAIESNLESVA
jgi:MFS transporter, DHA3 family, macrolide efflux protein